MPTIKDLPTSGLLIEALDLTNANAASKERLACVYELHHRGEPEIFEAAKNWCTSGEVTERVLAADILSQLGEMKDVGEETLRPFTHQTVPLLAKLLDDPDEHVVASSVDALDNHNNADPIVERTSLAFHPSKLVRMAVASALALAWDTTSPAINMLINLSQDQDGDVRDWATFMIGSMGSLDTPEIRKALFARVSDSDYDTRSEALLGLAKRNDERVASLIKAELEAESVGTLAVEAAGEIASDDLVEPLDALIEWWDVDTELLHTALKRCRGEANADEDWRWDNHATILDFQMGVDAYKGGDYATALTKWRPPAEHGHVEGQYNLGRGYRLGHGVRQDYAEAAKWYRKAAEQGDAKAQISLGLMYADGHGVPQDNVIALMWLTLGNAIEDKQGTIVRDTVTKKLPSAQIAEAQKLTQEWQEKHKKK
jgi:hypothetical protein